MISFAPPLETPRVEAALRDAREGSAEARWVAAMALGGARGEGRDEALAALLELSTDVHGEIRAQALEGLAEQLRGGGVTVDPGLLRSALEDPEAAVRCAAVDAVCEIDADPVADITPMLDDGDPSVRAVAAAALGDLGATEVADRLASMLADGDGFVVQRVALALGELGDPRSEELLVSFLGEDDELAAEAAAALGCLGLRSSVDALRGVATRLLCPVSLKATAAAAMTRCGEGEGVALIEKLLGSRRGATRLAVLGALASLPARGVAPRVASLARALDEIEASAAIGTLRALADVDRDATLTVLESLSDLPGALGEEVSEAVVLARETVERD